MQAHSLPLSFVAVLAILPAAQAQDDAAAKPATKAQRVALTYETAKDPGSLPSGRWASI